MQCNRPQIWLIQPGQSVVGTVVKAKHPERETTCMSHQRAIESQPPCQIMPVEVGAEVVHGASYLLSHAMMCSATVCTCESSNSGYMGRLKICSATASVCGSGLAFPSRSA